MLLYDPVRDLKDLLRSFFCFGLPAVNSFGINIMFSPVPSVVAVIQDQRLKIIHAVRKLCFGGYCSEGCLLCDSRLKADWMEVLEAFSLPADAE